MVWWVAIPFVLLLGAYFWQPYRYDLFPRPTPAFALMDPETAELFKPGAKVTIITAHPDDAEFYIGGLLTKLARSGAELSLVVCTRGDKIYNPIVDHATTADTRSREQTEAASEWNVRNIRFLDGHDGRLHADKDKVIQVTDALRRFQPEYILSFESVYPPRLSHRDHRTAGEIAEQAIVKAGVGKWILRFSTRAPNYVEDVTSVFEKKKELLHIHKSEFHGEKISRIDSLITRFAQGDGARIGVPLGEGLPCTRLTSEVTSSSVLPSLSHSQAQK